jgi:hypothetical protein
MCHMAYSKYLKVYTYTAERQSYVGSTLASYPKVPASHLGVLGLLFLLEASCGLLSISRQNDGIVLQNKA